MKSQSLTCVDFSSDVCGLLRKCCISVSCNLLTAYSSVFCGPSVSLAFRCTVVVRHLMSQAGRDSFSGVAVNDKRTAHLRWLLLHWSARYPLAAGCRSVATLASEVVVTTPSDCMVAKVSGHYCSPCPSPIIQKFPEFGENHVDVGAVTCQQSFRALGPQSGSSGEYHREFSRLFKCAPTQRCFRGGQHRPWSWDEHNPLDEHSCYEQSALCEHG